MDGQPCPTLNAQQLRVVQQLLWNVISQHLYPAERDEIRRALGGSLLDENEGLFAEAGALADILGDVQLNTSALLARHQLCSNPQRSMVEGEIRLLIERLHASASASPFGSSTVKERDPESLLPRSGRRDRAVLDYVTSVAQIAETGGRPPSAGLPPRPPSAGLSSSSRPGTSSRPPTALSASAASASASISLPSPLSRPGTASPTLHGSRPSTASSAASSAATRYTDAPSVVAGVADKLNVSNIDAVRETLRTALMDERAALLEDVEYLQGLLEAEADLQVRAAAPPPSLAELRDYSHRLAAVVADEEARLEHEVRVSAMFAAAEQQSSKAGRLRGMVDASRRPVSAGSGGSGGAATASPPETARRSSAAGGGGGAQTLVVHGSGEEEAVRQQQRPRPTSGSSAAAAASVPPTRDAGGVGVGSVSVSGSPRARAAPLAAVRRPGSSGSGADAPLPLPPVLPPRAAAAAGAAATALRPAGSLPSARLSHSPSSAAGIAASYPTKAPDSNGLAAAPSALASASASRLLHSPSPGKLRPMGQTAAAALPLPLPQHQAAQLQNQQATGQPQPHSAAAQPLAYRETSPSLVAASPSPARVPTAASAAAAAVSAGAAAAAAASAPPPPGLRPALPRAGSVGRTSTTAAAAGPTAAAASVGSSGGATRAVGRVSSSAIAGEAAAAAAAAAGGRTATANPTAASAASPAESYPTAVQPRALMGNKQSVVERLDEEVDKVKGGVAAILERYNIRPSTPSSSAAAAGGAVGAATATAAVVAPPPPGSRGS